MGSVFRYWLTFLPRSQTTIKIAVSRVLRFFRNPTGFNESELRAKAMGNGAWILAQPNDSGAEYDSETAAVVHEEEVGYSVFWDSTFGRELKPLLKGSRELELQRTHGYEEDPR